MLLIKDGFMIKRKKKLCIDCNEYKILFGKSLCQSCYNIQFKKPIKKVSEKHQQTLDEYKPKRLAFLKKRPNCELKLDVCTRKATCIHHKKGKHSKELYLDENYWMASCISCNGRVEEIGEKAYQLGLKIKHNSKI